MPRIFATAFCLLIALSYPVAAQHWQLLRSPTPRDLISVDFADSLHGGMVGTSATDVFLTSDGGLTWSVQHGLFTAPQAIATPRYPFVYVLDGTPGHSALFRSTNWGGRWSSLWTGDTTDWCTDLDFYSQNDGVIVGGRDVSRDMTQFHPLIFRSTNAGVNWRSAVSTNVTNHPCKGVSLYGPNMGLVAGSQTLPGGAEIGALYFIVGDVFAVYDTFPAMNRINDVDCLSGSEELEHLIASDRLWGFYSPAAGGWDFPPSDRAIVGVALAGMRDRWLIGQGGYLAHVGPGEIVPTVYPVVPLGAELKGIDFIDSLHGWAVGTQGTLLRWSRTSDVLPLPDSEELHIISVSPQPARDRLTVRLAGPATGWVTGTLWDLMGGMKFQIVAQEDEKIVIDLPGNLPDGVYVLRIQSGSLLSSQRIIISR